MQRESAAPVPASGGRHRKPKQTRVASRRARAAVVATPMAVAMFSGTSAFAADKGTTARPVNSVADKSAGSGSDGRMAANLNTRMNDPRLGPHLSGVVLDANSDRVVWGHDASTALMPASNTKLLTATAALSVLGPDHRFTTKVTYRDGTLTLVGGGDRLLTTADLTRLAQTSAAKLKSQGVGFVKVRVDDSLFPEPTQAKGWRGDYYPGEVAPVRALVVDGRSVLDTSVDAGKTFAKQLAAAGVVVNGDVTRGRAGASDVSVAQHRSPKLSESVRKMLKLSDNNIAETLLRMTALGTGRPATFEGGTAAVRQVLRDYGVPLTNVKLYDGSGLSRSDRIPAATLAAVLDLTQDHPQTLQPVLDGLPVSGEAGSTLGPEWGRFDDPHSTCAVGKVRAKTGTLSGAISLSGVTQGKDGRLKVFAFVENDASAAPAATKDALDGLAATVNGCWA
ncbi:D-alanyl-D-alanine carboxypeptidase/D-alanyl-D-alanine-endopeptidase [Streptomyces sp. SAJ15]|nr:D-alanyl-D-alanine carboxypeptidase/D-alanyl-D-alanine-endopeptidase [Streptomyces sp. SAJ15]